MTGFSIRWNDFRACLGTESGYCPWIILSMQIWHPLRSKRRVTDVVESANSHYPREERRVKALIIDEPWISMIVSGQKTWEMRSRNTQVRGRIGLIRKGSKTVIGLADLVD